MWRANLRRRRVLEEAPAVHRAGRSAEASAGASSSTPKKKLLADYRTLEEIRDRLAVLYVKADRMQRFLDSGCTAVYLLDDKQLAVIAPVVGDRLELECRRYFRTLRWTIDQLETRRSLRERANRKRSERRLAA